MINISYLIDVMYLSYIYDVFDMYLIKAGAFENLLD